MTELFDYVLLRFVGDPTRGEAVNVAVIVVDEKSGEAVIEYDRTMAVHLRRLWPDFDRRTYGRVLRDLQAVVGAPHQMALGQQTRGARPSAALLTDLRARLVNQFQLSAPRKFRASGVRECARILYDRLVARPRLRSPRMRYMTRSAIRDMISQLFAEWARGRQNLEFRPDTTLDGVRAPHPADVVAFEDGEPRFAFIALPLTGGDAQWAPYIRDSLPVTVDDVRQRHDGVEFFAVLGADPDSDVYKLYKAHLAGVEGLTVATLDELRRQFRIPTLATNSA
jgi:hypothetical protein